MKQPSNQIHKKKKTYRILKQFKNKSYRNLDIQVLFYNQSVENYGLKVWPATGFINCFIGIQSLPFTDILSTAAFAVTMLLSS